MKSRIIFLGFVLGVAGCHKDEGAKPAAAAAVAAEPGVYALPAGSPKLERLRVEALKDEEFAVDEVLAPGKVEANPNRIARVVMPVSGRVKQLLVKLGDAVTEGQRLALVESPEASAALAVYRTAQAGQRQAKSALVKAERDLERVKDLYEHRAAAQKEVQGAENDLVQAQAAVEQAQAAYEDGAKHLEMLGLTPGGAAEVPVKAPIPGKVLEIAVAPGEYRTDTGTPLLVVADLATVWLTADVPETQIRKVEKGEYIQVELSAFPGETWRGKVTRIADMVEPETRTIKVQAEVANPGGRLRPEMYGQIRHQHGTERKPAVAAGAVVQKDGKNVVLKEEAPGRFRETAVKLGARLGEMLAVEEGLKAGDRVVVDGAMLLRKE